MIARTLSTTAIALGSVAALVGVVALPTALPAWIGIGAAVGLSAPIVADLYRETPLSAAAHRRTGWLAGAATTGFLLVLVGSTTVLGPAAGTVLALAIALGSAARWTRRRRSDPVESLLAPAGTGGSPRIEDTTTAELCRVWQQSWFTLSELPPGPLRGRIAELRGEVLDELERRHPDGVRQWLESGARANGNPAGFLTPGPGAQ